MTHRDVTADQARAIAGPIVPALDYLGRLSERMRRRGFTDDDPLMSKVLFALEATRQLRSELHAIEHPPTPLTIAGAAQVIPHAETTPQWLRAMGPTE
jgi:hypothetical protein